MGEGMSPLQELLNGLPTFLKAEFLTKVLEAPAVQYILSPFSKEELLALFSALSSASSPGHWTAPACAMLPFRKEEEHRELVQGEGLQQERWHLLTQEHVERWHQVCNWVSEQPAQGLYKPNFLGSPYWVERALRIKEVSQALVKAGAWPNIQVWKPEQVPEFIKQLTDLDDTDWIVWIPSQDWSSMPSYCPSWVEIMDSGRDPEIFKLLDGSVVFVADH